MNHVFISHSTKDDALVARIREALEIRGLKIWVDSHELTAGAKLPTEVKRAIESASHFIVVVSAAALNSTWVAREFRHARRCERTIIPMLVPPVNMGVLEWLFDEEPVAIQSTDGPGAVQAALPKLLEALGERLPTD